MPGCPDAVAAGGVVGATPGHGPAPAGSGRWRHGPPGPPEPRFLLADDMTPLFSARTAFFGHDAGHARIAADRRWNRMIQLGHADLRAMCAADR